MDRNCNRSREEAGPSFKRLRRKRAKVEASQWAREEWTTVFKPSLLGQDKERHSLPVGNTYFVCEGELLELGVSLSDLKALIHLCR